MNGKSCVPKTYMNHPNQWKLRALLQELFTDPDPAYITKEIVNFLQKYPIPIDDFPLLKGSYSRTILFRSSNGFEAMAARWSRGAISSIHGHPDFMLYYVIEGRLGIDNYKKHGEQIKRTSSDFLSESQFLSSAGQAGTFDNLIHQVQAIEETLSLHISSDDATKGEVYSQVGVTL
jgi:hypothetical protein